MKRKIINFVTLLTIFGLVTMQSCTKETTVAPTAYKAAMPAAPVPGNDAVVAFTGTGQTINLTWTGTATSSPKWDVYFGNTASPALAASNVTSNAYSTTITAGGTYYWQVSTTDAHVTTTSPVWSFEVNSNPNVPTTPSPANNKIGVSCTATLSWAATDPEGDPLTFDLLLDQNSTPAAIAATGLTAASYPITAALSPNTVYYWQVVAHDPYGGGSVSPIWKFTTGALPIAAFTGNYTVDEPAEGWTYPATFTMVDPTTLDDNSYWASWDAHFTLNFTSLTYSMPLTTFTSGYSGVESGVIDPSTGTMTGTYTIFHNGTPIEQGPHTYTKDKK